MIDDPQWSPKRAGWLLSEALRRLNLTHAQARRVVIHTLAAVAREIPEDVIQSRIWVSSTASYALEAIFHDELTRAIAKYGNRPPGTETPVIDDAANNAYKPARYIHLAGVPETIYVVLEVAPCRDHEAGEPAHDAYLFKGAHPVPHWECSRRVTEVEAAPHE